MNQLKYHGYINRQKYLEVNDWQAIKYVEQGTAIPQEIIDRKQQARDEMELILNAVDISEIEHLTIEFN